MSTRGFLGFVVNDVEKIAYNHEASGPYDLGLHVLRWLRNTIKLQELDVVRKQAHNLRVVDEDSEPTDEDIKHLTRYADLTVSTGSVREWYCLLRRTQGRPELILDAGVLIDGSAFPVDGVWADYGYIVDFDRRTFEAFEGDQEQTHDKGRFAGRRAAPADLGAPCALVAEWGFDELPSDEDFLWATDREQP